MGESLVHAEAVNGPARGCCAIRVVPSPTGGLLEMTAQHPSALLVNVDATYSEIVARIIASLTGFSRGFASSGDNRFVVLDKLADHLRR